MNKYIIAVDISTIIDKFSIENIYQWLYKILRESYPQLYLNIPKYKNNISTILNNTTVLILENRLIKLLSDLLLPYGKVNVDIKYKYLILNIKVSNA